MSTYSTNLALELIGTGERSGTWGTATNTNLGTLIEQAISGYVTQTITDGVDTTITIPNGASGVARNMYIEATGTLTASRNLVVPANKKLYFIYNNTTGGFPIVVKVSGQTGITVPNQAKVSLVCDGTDVRWGVTHLMASSSRPSIAFEETDQAANSKVWDIAPISGNLEFRLVNDAQTSTLTYLKVYRTGITSAYADYSGGTFRVTTSASPASGSGIELAYQAGTGYLTAYDRSAASWQALQLRSSSTTFLINNSTTAAIDSSGVKSLIGLPYYAFDSTNTQSTAVFQNSVGGWVSVSSGRLNLSATATNFVAHSTSGAATAGAATLPANPVGFLILQIDGTEYKFPYYSV